MKSSARIRSISYLKRHAAQIAEELERSGSPFVITRDGAATMVIEGVKSFQEKAQAITLGERGRGQGKGLSVAESRALLLAARQHPTER